MTKLSWLESRKATTSATSSGVPIRPCLSAMSSSKGIGAIPSMGTIEALAHLGGDDAGHTAWRDAQAP